MQRLAAILLTLAFLATGSGGAAHAHRLGHAHAADHHAAPEVQGPAVVADDADAGGDGHACATCLLLTAPVLPPTYAPPGLAPGSVEPAHPAPADRPNAGRAPLRIDCRGPPVG